jgi:general secretion pathway protein K
LFDSCEVEDGYGLVRALADWIDKDEEIRPYGTEDNDYMLKDPAYLAANQPMVSPTELLLVKGVTPENYACLAPYIAVLPTETGINVNTAEAEVIAAFSDDISIVAAEEIVKDRPDSGYSKIEDFMAVPALAGTGVMSEGLALNSNYFLVQGQADYGAAKIDLNSIYSRSTGLWTLLGRSIGTY